jgi:hypothetical protein
LIMSVPDEGYSRIVSYGLWNSLFHQKSQFILHHNC